MFTGFCIGCAGQLLTGARLAFIYFILNIAYTLKASDGKQMSSIKILASFELTEGEFPYRHVRIG